MKSRRNSTTRLNQPAGPVDDTTQIIMTQELAEKLRAKERVPSLIVIDGEDSGQIFKLTSNAISLGRGTSATYRLNDKTVSRKHFLLEVTPLGVTLIDLQSANGTFVDGERVLKKKLANGNKIRIGNTVMKFEITDTDESEFHERVYQLITFDDLTSLYNRKFLFSQLEMFFKTKKLSQPLSILFLDLDHFKLVNDNFDHLTGSEVLSEVGRLLLSNLRTTDMACRYGGEEFVIILQNNTASQAAFVAEKLRKLVEGHTFSSREGHPIHITVSIGIAEKTPAIKTVEDFIARSDEAMYKAKEGGRNSSVLYIGDPRRPFIQVTSSHLLNETRPPSSPPRVSNPAERTKPHVVLPSDMPPDSDDDPPEK